MSKCSVYLNCNPENQREYSRDGDLVFVECNDCGLIWRSSESDYISKKYDAAYFRSKNYSKNRNHKIDKSKWLISIARKFNPDIKRLLEVGCSVGNTLEAGEKMGIDSFGIDISRYAVDYCRKLGLNAENISLEQLTERGDQFDLICMQHVLEHFPDPFNVLQKCRKLLNEGGLLLILVPNSNYKRAVKGRGKHRFYSIKGVGPEHHVYFNYDTITRVLEIEGFDVVQKNYPLSVNGDDSIIFYANRQFRRSLTTFNSDQEILVVARMKNQL